MAAQALSIVSAASGIVLASLGYLSAVSGFCMRDPLLVGWLTLGLFSEYSFCSYVHLELTPLLISIVAVVHAIATIELIHLKLKGSRLAYIMVYVFKLVLWVLAVQLAVIAVLDYSTR